MNPLEHLEQTGHGRRCFLVGNGPSLTRMNLDLLKDEVSFAMNRIALIYPSTSWRPTYYIFCSSNCLHPVWGADWSQSVMQAATQPGVTAFIAEQFRAPIEKHAGRPFPENTIFLAAISEHQIGSADAFSTDASLRLDKSGTSMHVALQLAYYLGFDPVYLIGCDSNWQRTGHDKSTPDPNHFHPDYHANIPNGAQEFLRMNETHKAAALHFRLADRTVLNAGLDSAITAYPRVAFSSLF